MQTSPAPHWRPLAVALALVGSLAGTLPGTPVRASAEPRTAHRGGLVVTNCNDDGPGSLRAALAGAGDDDTIDLGQLECDTITLTSGALVAGETAHSLHIHGPAKSSAKTLTISGNHTDRVFEHRGGGRLELHALSITSGRRAGGNGGCVYSHGSVNAQATRLSDCAVSGQEVHGGAIFARDDVVLVESAIAGSSASGMSAASGGAIHAGRDVRLEAATLQANVAIAANGPVRTGLGGGVYAGGTAFIAHSTLTGNHAVTGGGVYAVDLTIHDSTLSANFAEGWGAGVVQVGLSPIEISNSTIAFNHNGAGAGAGVHVSSRANIVSTIIAGNTAGHPGIPTDVAGEESSFVAGAHNLIRAAGIPVPSDTITADPLLDPLLQDNGGLTPTHALLPGSPAIDHGSNPLDLCCDQRLQQPETHSIFERVVGAAADIGAYETGAPDRMLADGFDGKEARR